MRSILVSLAVIVGCLSISTEARADDAAPATKPSAQRSVVVIPPTVIYGRWVKPCVAVEIDRIAPAFTTSETPIQLVDRIEGTLYGALFL